MNATPYLLKPTRSEAEAREIIQRTREARLEILLRPEVHLFGQRPFKCNGLAMLGEIANRVECDVDEIEISEGDIEATAPACFEQIYVRGEHKGWVE